MGQLGVAGEANTYGNWVGDPRKAPLRSLELGPVVYGNSLVASVTWEKNVLQEDLALLAAVLVTCMRLGNRIAAAKPLAMIIPGS